MKQRAAWLAVLVAAAAHAAGPNVLNNTGHAASSIYLAVDAQLGGTSDINAPGGLYLDATTSGDSGSCANDAAIIAAAQSAGPFYRITATGPPWGPTENQSPWLVTTTSCSFSSQQLPNADVLTYATLYANGAIDSYAFVPVNGTLAGTQPPTLATNILPTSGNASFSLPGIEFGMTANYTLNGINVNGTTPSGSEAAFGGFLAALKFAAPSANWFDIKSALRATAANWSTGYASASYGYGAINVPAAATALATGGTAIYLQPPGLSVAAYGNYALLTLYPFRSSRRQSEIVVGFSSAPTWLAFSNNEYTYAQLQSLMTSYGGTIVYQSNGTDVIPNFEYVAAMNVTIYFAAFSTTAANAAGLSSATFSRGEAYSAISATLTASSKCYEN